VLQRILVVGISGAGKTTYAQALAVRRGLPFHEMDLLAIGPGWSLPDDFVQRVDEITESPVWVFDSYGHELVRDRLWSRADTVVWLDFARRVTWPRMVRRSLRRTLTREQVFHGNRETVGSWFRSDHPVWHAWRDHGSRRAYLAERLRDPRFGHLEVHRFEETTAAYDWL
jgi:hypothetical protein